MTDFWAQSFDSVGNDPAYWRSRARSLITAAAILWPYTKLGKELEVPSWFLGRQPHKARDRLLRTGRAVLGPMCLLRAFAVECLLKAVWLRRGNLLARGGQFPIKGTPRSLASHRLLAIARAVDFGPLDDDEAALLERLTIWSVIGRYPITRRWQDKLVDQPRQKGLGTSWGSSDDRVYNRLVRRLRREAGASG